MKKIQLLIIVLFCTGLSAKTQIIRTKLDAVAGASAMEFVHAGIRYQYTDFTQIGIALGGDLGFNPGNITTYSFDHMIHFGALSFYSNRPVWYARQGFTYLVDVKEKDWTEKYSYLNIGAGREFALNNWLGFNADLGIAWQLNLKTEKNGVTTTDNYRKIRPLARVQFFISF